MTIKFGKRAGIIATILLVIAVIYNTIYFAVPWNWNMSTASFWITYGFTYAALIFAAVTAYLTLSKKNVSSRIFTVPVLYVGIGVLVSQLVLDFIVMGVGTWYTVWFWITLIIEVLIYGIAICGVITKNAAVDHIEYIEKQSVRKVYIQQLRVELASLLEANTMSDIQADLEKLNELVKYTNPVSSKEVEDLEDQITVAFEDLEKAVAAKEVETSKTLIAKVTRLINQRKAILLNK